MLAPENTELLEQQVQNYRPKSNFIYRYFFLHVSFNQTSVSPVSELGAPLSSRLYQAVVERQVHVLESLLFQIGIRAM